MMRVLVARSPSRPTSCAADRRRSSDAAAHDTARDLRDDRAASAAGRHPHSSTRPVSRGRPATLAGPEARAIAGGVNGDERHTTTVSKRRLGSGHHDPASGRRQYRERKRASRFSKSAAQRWAQDRERYCCSTARRTAQKEVPTLEAFAPRFVDGHARANRHKPSGIAAIESILKWHLVPTLGPKRLDAITNEQVQRLKLALAHRAPKTVNNVLTVLSTLLKKAVEWGELERLPCAIKLLPNPKKTMGFHDFDQYERLLTRRTKRGSEAYLMVLVGGDAGLRLGEIIALEWRDIDLAARRLTVQRSDWLGHVTVPKGGRSRQLPMTQRLTAALKAARHLRSRARVVPAGWIADHARSRDQSRPRRSARRGHRAGRAHPAAHVLFAPGDEGRACAGHPGAGRPRGPVDDAALHAPESGGNGRRDPVARRATIRRSNAREKFGDILDTREAAAGSN